VQSLTDTDSNADGTADATRIDTNSDDRQGNRV
jgi:hypothetical protein